MACDWKTNSNEKIGNVKYICKACKVLSFKVFSLALVQNLKKGQGRIVIESDSDAICKDFSEMEYRGIYLVT